MAAIKEGSFRTLSKISLPLMLSSFSTFFMMFIDRLFLAHLSEEAFSAAAGAGSLASALFFTPVAIAGMSQIFISQFNGAQKWNKLGESTWQMLYFALLSTLLLLPLGYFGKYFLSPLENAYFSLTLYFSPVLIIVAAIQSFYLGQGKLKTITLLILLSNGLNILLDPLLIFGWGSLFPPLGIQGAALATGLSELIKMGILLILFFSRENRTLFHTSHYLFNWPHLKNMIKIGLPSSLYESFEILGWAAFFFMMALISPTHSFIASVIQSIMLLFLFSETALEKGAATIAGNLIGSKQIEHIRPLLNSCFLLIFLFSLPLFALILFTPNLLLSLFYKGHDQEILFLLNQSLIILGIYIILENIRWTLGGILSAAGDTLYLMTSTFLLTFFTLILPLYLFVYLREQNILHAFFILTLYSLLSVLSNAFRFIQGQWREISLMNENP